MSFSEYFVMSFTLSIGNTDTESETVNIKSNNVKLNDNIYECGTISSENIQIENSDILKFDENDLDAVAFYGNQITLISDNNEMTFYPKEKTTQEYNNNYLHPIDPSILIQNYDSCCRHSCLNIYHFNTDLDYFIYNGIGEELLSYFSCSELIDIIVSFEEIERFKTKDNKNCTFKNIVLTNPDDEVQNHKYKCEWIETENKTENETENETENILEEQEDTEVKIVLRKLGTQQWNSWCYKKYRYAWRDTNQNSI